MDFDECEYHIIQKYRLAIAISVLKTKPEEISVEQHIEDLKNKLDDKMDLDTTICSDDFNLDDDIDFDDINKQIDDLASNNVDDDTDFGDINNQINVLTENNVDDDTNFNDINDDFNKYNNTQLIYDQNKNNNSDTLSKNDNCDEASKHFGKKSNKVKEKDFSDVIHLFKDNDHNPEYHKSHYNTILTQATYCESLEPCFEPTLTLESVPDNDSTMCESIDLDDDSCDFYTFNNDRSNECHVAANKEILNAVEREDQNMPNNVSNMRPNERHLTQNNELQNPEFSLDNNLTYYDSQATEIYTLHGFTQNYTHVSQSQNCNFDISEKFITGVSKTLDRNIDFKVKNVNKKSSQNCNDNTDDKFMTDDMSNNLVGNENNDNEIKDIMINVLNKDSIQVNIKRTNELDTQTDKNRNNFEKSILETAYIQDFSENAQRDFYSNDYIHEDNVITNVNRNTGIVNLDKNSNGNGPNIFPDDLSSKANKIDQEMNIQEPEKSNLLKISLEDICEEELTLQRELVPFKVIEELNKIKTFLNRRERKMSYDGSSDSGYKGDSEGKSQRNSLQLSGVWLNQSAHCLYDYITRCPLVGSAQDITDDISQVLGELIDKLHEEETYPLFLEELLDYHDSLVQEIQNAEATLLEKDESIQRFLLLNKSTHILKYSIEKLTYILDDLYKKLKDEENFYELTNILEVENTSYIFHILEIIIKRYLKSKDIIDNTQLSQTSDNILKKSSITDVWRKKWNPNYQDDVEINVSIEKQSVFTKCSEVLNKIVSECMGGYSLIAFAALQCFNLMQL